MTFEVIVDVIIALTEEVTFTVIAGGTRVKVLKIVAQLELCPSHCFKIKPKIF